MKFPVKIMPNKCGKCGTEILLQVNKPYKEENEDSLPNPLPMERLPRGPIQCDKCLKEYQETREMEIHTINKSRKAHSSPKK